MGLVMRCLKLAVASWGALWAMAAHSGALSVAPVRLELSAPELTGALTVTNTGTESSVVQLEATDWSQRNGQDEYAPSRELLATPPIFTLAPGASQIVRVGLRRPPDPRRELAYRLFLQEIPPPPKIGSTELRVALRIGVPVFISASKSRPELRVRARRAPGDEWLLTFDNVGAGHIQIGEVSVFPSGGKDPLASQRIAAYVLPGSQRVWPMKMRTPVPLDTSLELSIQSDRGALREKIVLEP
jgi:fimbrial chaperone protein